MKRVFGILLILVFAALVAGTFWFLWSKSKKPPVEFKTEKPAVMDIVKNHCGAYGVGVEYAYTMVHGAPATAFPEYAIPAAGTAHK